jgi:hypothetical protein
LYPFKTPLKAIELDPLATVTEFGRMIFVDKLLIASVVAARALWVSVAVQVVLGDKGYAIAFGVHVNLDIKTATLTRKVCVMLPALAVIVAVIGLTPIATVVMVKFAELAPAGMLTVAGTFRADALLVRVTVCEAAVTPVIATVQVAVEDDPICCTPDAVGRTHVSDEKVAGRRTVMLPLFGTPL